MILRCSRLSPALRPSDSFAKKKRESFFLTPAPAPNPEPGEHTPNAPNENNKKCIFLPNSWRYFLRDYLHILHVLKAVIIKVSPGPGQTPSIFRRRNAGVWRVKNPPAEPAPAPSMPAFCRGFLTWNSAGDAGAGVLPEVPNLKRISPAKR